MKKIILMLLAFIVFAACEKQEAVQHTPVVKETAIYNVVVSFSNDDVFGAIVNNDSVQFKQFQEKDRILIGDSIMIVKYDDVFRFVALN